MSAGIHLVTVSDNNQCQDTLQLSLSEPEALLVEETITHPYCKDSYDGSLEIAVSGGTPSYYITWSDGSLGMKLDERGPGSVELEVTDGNQCIFTSSYTLASENENCVTIYEIITPNNDGYNDTWRMPGLEYYPNATVEVYDQWGKQVFYSRGYEQPWDGTYDGKVLPMASYHYVVNLGNGSAALVGNITIMK
jgi:gliding motility-associated-like protein